MSSHCSQPCLSLPPTTFFFRNSKGKRYCGAVSLSRSSAAYSCPELHTHLGPKKSPKRVICKKGPWTIVFPSATNLPSSSMNVSTRDNKNEDIIMATSNHQATSNSLNTHQIQHPGRPILCFTNRFTNHFTTKGCTKPNFYQYQPKICNAFTRTKLLLSIFCGAKRQIFAQLLPLFVFHYKAKIRTLQ